MAEPAAWFEKPAEEYDRFVGRYTDALARSTVARAGLSEGSSALDVGCGPGALTWVLAKSLGAEHVAAVDPSEPFARACAERVPEADVRVASADALPFEDQSFDATLSQLVVNFLPDAPAGLREMRRVTRPGGLVVATVWDYAGEMTMLRAYWDAAVELDAAAESLDERKRMRYSHPDELASLWADGGLIQVATEPITVSAVYEDFDDLWRPFTAGIGPAGSHCISLSEASRNELRESYRGRLGSPQGQFELSARAWLVIGRVPER